MSDAGPTILFAGGGSGGHIAPGLAVIERLAELAPDATAVFACSQREVDRRMLAPTGLAVHPLPAAPLALGPRGIWRFASGFHRSRSLARDLIRRAAADHVVALGGFVAAPVVAAARAAGVPTLLVNLDVPPGKANRWLARRCDRAVTAIAMPPAHRPFRAEVVGMPVRRAAIATQPAGACRAALGLDPDRPTLLVMGGSQGASSLNTLTEAMITSAPAAFDGWQVLHLAGAGAAPRLADGYRHAGVAARVEAFLDRMDLAWGAADLAVCRAGANAVGEVAANAVPALFLPYPHHRDQHQRFNAAPLVEQGGAALCDDLVDPERNAAGAGRALLELMGDPARRSAMRAALGRGAARDAAGTIARMILDGSRRTAPTRRDELPDGFADQSP